MNTDREENLTIDEIKLFLWCFGGFTSIAYSYKCPFECRDEIIYGEDFPAWYNELFNNQSTNKKISYIFDYLSYVYSDKSRAYKRFKDIMVYFCRHHYSKYDLSIRYFIDKPPSIENVRRIKKILSTKYRVISRRILKRGILNIECLISTQIEKELGVDY